MPEDADEMNALTDSLEDAVVAWFTGLVELPTCPLLEDGALWWEDRHGDGWLYPWRVKKVDGVMQGYPCGEPKKIISVASRPDRA
jgi:hypothetical protein